MRTSAGAMARIARALGIHPGERFLVVSTSSLFAVSMAAVGLSTNAADTLFFLRFGVEFLPRMIFLSGIVVMVVILLYAGGLGRVGAKGWLPMVLALLAGVLVLERLGIVGDWPAIYPTIWLVGQAIVMVVFTLIWNTAAEVCDTRQAKRLFPLFASAGIIGGVVGNASTGPLAAALGTENLLLVAAVFLVAGTAAALVIGSRLIDAPVQQRTSVLANLTAGFTASFSNSMLRLMVGIGLALNALFFLVVFPFAEIVTDSLGTEAEVAGYLGVFSSVATAVTFIVSLTVANRLFARLGVVISLMIVPLVYMVGFGLWLGSFTLATASAFRGLQWVAVNAVGSTAWSSLFNVLSREKRGQVMAFMTAGPAQIGTLISGAILLVGAAMSQQTRNITGLALAVLVLLMVWMMRPAYSAALVDAVKRGLVDVFTAPVSGMQKPELDADTLDALAANLDEERPAARAMAITMVGRFGDPRGDPLVARAMEDQDPTVRAAALAVMSGHPDKWEASIAKLIADPDPEVRTSALQTVRNAGMAPPPQAHAALTDDHPTVRAAAATVVGGDPGRRVVEHLLASEDRSEIITGLEAAAQRPELVSSDLTRLLDHPDRLVRSAAAMPLALRGEVNGLRRLLDDPSITTRRAVAEALASTADGVPVLLQTLEDGSVRATDAALRALTDHAGGGRLTQWAATETGRASYLHRHRMALDRREDKTATGEYLIHVLKDREERLERWAIMALATPDRALAMATISRGMWSTDVETRSQALEALDSMANRVVARELLALLEHEHKETESTPHESLRELSTDFDEWIRALAIRCLAEDLRAGLELLTRTAGNDPSALVREAVSRWEVPTMKEARTLDRMECVLALSRVPMLRGIDPEDLERIAAVITERHYDPDEIIFSEGDEGDEMLLVIRGKVYASVQRDGVVSVVREFGPGDHVGELSLLLGRPRVADVIAGPEGAHALALGSREFQSILEERPEAALAMLATLAERLATT